MAFRLLLCIVIGVFFNLLSVCATQYTDCEDCTLQSECEANANCVWSNNDDDHNLNQCISNTNPCPYISIPSLNRAIPLNKCMKLNYNSEQYTLFTCYNDIVYKEEYIDNNCNNPPTTSIKTNDYHTYNCKGSIESCNYVKLLSFEECVPTNYTIDKNNGNYTITYELTHRIYETSDTNHYISTCTDNTYSITTDTEFEEIHPHCIDGERVFVDECHIPWNSDTDCAFIFDFDEEYAVPLDTCNTKYDENISYEYQCEDSKIYKCIYNDTHCKGSCMEHEYTGYDLPNCDISVCSMVQYNIFENCENKRESKSIVVDVCMSNDKYNTSVMWKCKAYSMAKYVYNGTVCDMDELIDTQSMVFNEECEMINNEYISMEIVSCSSPPCRLTQDIHSYQICNIFENTNVGQVIPFWDTYDDDYCDWLGDDAAFDFNIYQCDSSGWGLTLSLAASRVSGSLNTTHYSWPNDLHRLNLNDLGLNGEWYWWSLVSDTLEYIDISNNNFSGTLQLLPLLYSDRLETIKISNNPLMSGYIDWPWMSYMTNAYLNVFVATDISWSGYADFTLIPEYKDIFIELDKGYQCNPYKYICKRPLYTVDRSMKGCMDKSSCEATCICSDGSTATSTQFPHSPVVGVISCGDTIDSTYDYTSTHGATRNIWGDDGHYYLIQIPDGYSEVNITFDARSSRYFDGRIVVYSLQDIQHNVYKQIYDVDNPLKLTVTLTSERYYYLQIIASTSIDGEYCMEHDDDDVVDRDEYWYLFNQGSGFYQSGYECDYSLYAYSISMDGCTASPTYAPTVDPTVFYSTTDIIRQDIAQDTLDNNVIFNVDTYMDGWTINDTYGRIEILIKIWIKSELQMDNDCFECFEWLLQDMDDMRNAEYISLNEYYGYTHEDITFYNTQSGLVIVDGIVYDVIDAYLIITSITTQNAGYCPDNTKIASRILHPDNTYRLKLSVSVNQYISIESEPISLSTHSAPTGGTCMISTDDNSGDLWNKYTLSCTDWHSHVMDNEELRYNLLYENIPYAKEYKSNPLSVSIGGSGDTMLTALIQDSVSAISCYDVMIAFPEINNTNIDNLTKQISNIVYLSDVDNRMDIVSIFGSIRGVLSSEYIVASTYKTYSDLSDTLFDILLSSSVVLHTNYSVSLQDILHEVSILIVATHPDGYIGSDALQILIHNYTPALLQSMKHHSDDDMDLYAMSTTLFGLIDNLNCYVSSLIAESFYINDLVSAVIDDLLDVSHLALLRSYPGEIFNYSVDNKEIIAQKFKSSSVDDGYKIKCGFDNEYVLIPNEISTDHVIFDCSFLRIHASPNTMNKSHIISINLYEEESHVPINIYQTTSACDPYLITFQFDLHGDHLNYSLYQNTALPMCVSWSNSSHDCFVYDVDMNWITCGCTSVGTHEVQLESSIIIPNVIPSWNWRNVSLQTLEEHRIAWISIGVLFMMISCLCGLKWMDKTVNRPILAYEDVIFVQSRNERMKNDISGKEIAYIEKYLGSFDRELLGNGMCRFPMKSLCGLHCALFMVYLLNGHIFLSIFSCRPSGSNLSIPTRIALFFMYLCIVMALTGAVYGLQIHMFYNNINDVAVCYIISLLSVFPVYCIKQLFVKSKPKTVRKKIFLYEDIKLKRMSSMNDSLDDKCILDYLRDSQRDLLAKCEDGNLNGVYRESLTRIKRNSVHEKMSTLDTAVEELRKTTSKYSNVHRLQLVDDIRITLLNTLYPFPHLCKCIAWILLIFCTLFVCAIAILFSLQFDLQYSATPNPNCNHLQLYEAECWQNNRVLSIESQLSYAYIDALNDNIESDQWRQWLTSCAISLLFYVLIIEPIYIYIATWCKIWMFSHNLSMMISAQNVHSLCSKVCCNSETTRNTYKMTRNDTDGLSGMSGMSGLSGVSGTMNTGRARSSSYNMVHPDRPLDVFGYLSNDDLFLSIDSKSGKLRAIDDNGNNNDRETPSVDVEYYINTQYHYHDHDDEDQDENITVIRHDTSSSSQSHHSHGHGRQQSYTDLSVTVTENGEFDSRELAMIRVAAGNIFDYKADIIHEGNEMEEEDSNLFSFDVNSDGIEESDDVDDDDVAISHISTTAMALDDDFTVFDTFDESDCVDLQIQSETLTNSETNSETDDATDPDDLDEDGLIDTITLALSDDSNKDFHERHTTESVLNQATNILTAKLYPDADIDDDNDQATPVPDNDYDYNHKRHHQKTFFVE